MDRNDDDANIYEALRQIFAQADGSPDRFVEIAYERFHGDRTYWPTKRPGRLSCLAGKLADGVPLRDAFAQCDIPERTGYTMLARRWPRKRAA